MKFAEDIIVRPIITEKSSFAMREGKYTFEVSRKATKIGRPYAFLQSRLCTINRLKETRPV